MTPASPFSEAHTLFSGFCSSQSGCSTSTALMVMEQFCVDSRSHSEVRQMSLRGSRRIK